MKKIGIITYHNALNLGAVLQTYALNYYINSLGYNCETINYKCEKIDNSYKLIDAGSTKKIIKSFINIRGNIVKNKKFSKFLFNNVKVSKEIYNKDNIIDANSKYNIFITGSDQVWNYGLNEDENYFLKFVNKKNKKSSYAASFGNNGIIEKYGDKVLDNLKKFDLISVRENSSNKILNDRLNLKSVLVLDPTFLLTKKDWDKFVVKDKYKNRKYILVYLLHEKEALNIAKKIKALTGYSIKLITNSISFNAKRINDAGIEEFLTLIKNSEYVITDSFHGTALSIILRKNLKVVLKNANKHLNDRLISILNLFNLEDCIVNSKDSDKKILQKVDYKDSEKLINKWIDNSKKVIDKIVK